MPAHTAASGSYQDPSLMANTASSDHSLFNNHVGAKKQKTTPPCDRCRQRRIKCDRLEPTCSSCIKYKATCVRTAFPAGVPLSTVSVDAIGGPGLRGLTPGKRDRHLTETEILDSCLHNVQSVQMHRLRRIEQFFDMLRIDETRLEEVGWLTKQIKAHQEHAIATNSPRSDRDAKEIAEKLQPQAPVSWIRQLMPLLRATESIQQIPSTAHAYPKPSITTSAGTSNPLQATLSESGSFICPTPKPASFPTRVPLSILNKTMFELSVYDCTQYLGPVAGTRATSWAEEMRFPLPWVVPEPQVQESLLVLPPVDQMLELIEWMIQSPLYIYFPILTKATILNTLSSALPSDDPPLGINKADYLSDSLGEESTLPQRITGRVSAVFLLNAIMALGAAYRSNAVKQNTPHRLLTNYESKDSSLYDFQLFFDRSRALTVYILDQPRISSLQGLLLLMKCPAIPGIQNLYREQACAMALALGLHRDPEPWTLCRSVIQLRRNIFWCCYVIDASYSLNSGSPERFPDDYITIGLPTPPSVDSGDDVGEIDAENETRRIGFLTEQAKLWKIVKKIRRCGQTSNKSSEGYCEGANIFRGPDAHMAQHQDHSSNGTSNHSFYSQLGSAKTIGQETGPSQPPWIWRADSARRILDIELAQWQMNLPQNLRFDFELTRQDVPCPYAVRVNGLGAMLQIIFNEVLILLHHPFLMLADSQAQSRHDQVVQLPGRHSKSRSSTSFVKSPRSCSSSATSRSRSSFSSSLPRNNSFGEDAMNEAARSLPPFLNSCTKAAEAITFLVDHLLRTTPEWLVCHNEVESALHFAERVHSLNSAMAGNNTGPGAGYAVHINGQQARVNLRRTRSFRKSIKDLDQFTMSTGYRPDLMTKELLARGSPRQRLMRSIRQLLTHKRDWNYYRLPRSPLETEVTPGKTQSETDTHVASTAGQDHLEMRLAFFDQRIWLRYYNIRIKDGIESRNGAESWLEILNPFVSTSESDVDTDDDDEASTSRSHGYSSAEELSMSVYEAEDIHLGNSHHRGSHAGRKGSGEGDSLGSKDSLDDLIGPPPSSSEALMELFNNPNPAGVAAFEDMIAESTFHSNFQISADQKKGFSRFYGIEPGPDGTTSYFKPYGGRNRPLDDFDGTEPPLLQDNPSHGQTDMFRPEYSAHGFQVSPYGSASHQQRYPHHQSESQQRHRPVSSNNGYSGTTFQQQPHPLQQDQCGPYSEIKLQGSSVMGFDSSAFPSPVTTGAGPVEFDLLSVSAPLSLQPALAVDGGRYLSLLQQHFPHEQIPSQPHGGVSMQSFQQLQTLDPSVNAAHQSVRPFYGMPVGGFMAPTLDVLPEVNRTDLNGRCAPRTALPPSTPPLSGQQQQHPSQQQQQQQQGGSVTSWTLNTQPVPGSTAPSLVNKPEPLSPALPSSLSSSIPPSPLPQSPLRLVLSSPTTDALSHRMNSWEGLSGAKTDSQLEYYNITTSAAFQQQTISTASASAALTYYANSWSSASPTSDIMTSASTTSTTNSSTPRSSVAADGLFSDLGAHGGGGSDLNSAAHALMDGVEAEDSPVTSSALLSATGGSNVHPLRHQQQHQNRHPRSAVPEELYHDSGPSLDDRSLL
ncbi:hypothetical protein EDD11_010562 [Mortierella claussenii]|nr:hypothetical protein EDD11_010562 [Mortierella claussenii]